MGLIKKTFRLMFGKSKKQKKQTPSSPEQQRKSEYNRYNELLKQGHTAPEALYLAKKEQKERIEVQNAIVPEKVPIQTGPPRKGRLQRIREHIIDVDRTGRTYAKHLEKSGFFSTPRSEKESIFDYNRMGGWGKQESIFQPGAFGWKAPKKKHKKHKKGQKKGRQIVINLNR